MYDGIEINSAANLERIQNRSGQTIAFLELEMMRARRYQSALSVVAIFSAAPRDTQAFQFRQANIERRLTKIAPRLLRYSDFWGRVDRTGFVIVLTETALDGADDMVRRLVDEDEFQQILREEMRRDATLLGCAEFAPEITSAKLFLEAARAAVVWRSDGA